MLFQLFSCGTGEKMGNFISLRNDFVFKEIFRNETVRRYFVSNVLGIPQEEIRSVRLHNTFLWTQHKRQKQGILDVLLILNDNSKINIELQIRMQAYWDRRSLFYLAKVFTADLLRGENYHKLQRSIGINILNFNLDNGPEYHKVYRLRDKAGREFSDMIEVHIIELNKRLSGTCQTDEWIKLFRARTKEELDMLGNQTKNPGILEAVKELSVMNLSKRLRAIHEFNLREQRDKAALEEQIKIDARAKGLKEGREEGRMEGRMEGLALKLIELTQKKLRNGKSTEQIAQELEEPLADVERICKAAKECGLDADTMDVYSFLSQMEDIS